MFSQLQHACTSINDSVKYVMLHVCFKRNRDLFKHTLWQQANFKPFLGHAYVIYAALSQSFSLYGVTSKGVTIGDVAIENGGER